MPIGQHGQQLSCHQRIGNHRGGQAPYSQPTTLGANLIGTPDALWEQHLRRKPMVGGYVIVAHCSFGGMPYELVHGQVKRSANSILPKLKS